MNGTGRAYPQTRACLGPVNLLSASRIDGTGRRLSYNEGLPWSLELIEHYEGRWDWERLSKNTALPWSFELIEQYKGRWDWERLSKNTALPWSLELIERFKDRWDWGQFFLDGLSGNAALPWSLELIERFEDLWDWHSAGVLLRRTKILVLSSSAIDGLMTHFADLEDERRGRERPESSRVDLHRKLTLTAL